MTFSIVQAAFVRNLVANPSIETNTTGWAPFGAGAVSQSATQAYRGRYSLRVTPDAALTAGGQYTMTLTASTLYTVSIYVYGALNVPYRLDAYHVAAAVSYGNWTTWTGGNSWTRQVYTFTTGAGSSTQIRVLKNSSASILGYYLDAVQVETGAVVTDYCDGDQDGCYWLNAPHAGMSERSAQSRAGGREYTFESLGWTPTRWTGLGLPSWRHTAVTDPTHGGGTYQGSVPKERSIVLTLHHQAADVATLHDARKLLTDALGPKVLARDQPFLLRCDLTGETAEIACVYDDGLGSTLDPGFQQTVQLRLLAFEPRWRGLKDEAAILDPVDTSTARYVVGRSGAEQGLSTAWDTLNLTANPTGTASGGPDIVVAAMVEGPDGSIYVAGDFTGWNNLSTSYRGVVKYDPVTRTWSHLNGTTSGYVRCLMFGSDGLLWAGGDFVNLGGVATKDYIAVWNGTTWDTPGGLDGADNVVRGITQGADGYVYAVGSFATIGGVAAAKVARWSGSAWSAVGTGLVGVAGYSCATGVDGSVYVGGNFTTAGGVAAVNIARYSALATTPVWSALGAGLSDSCLEVRVGRDNTVYAAGNFNEAGGIDVNNVAAWNGASWKALGTGLDNGYASAIGIDPTTNGVYFGGSFTLMSGIPMADSLARWNGKAWVHVDINLPGTAGTTFCWALLVTRRGTPYVGFNGSNTMRAAGLVGVTVDCDAEVYPRIYFTRTAGGGAHTLEMIRNETTGAEIPLRLPLQDGEGVVLDLRRPAPYVASSLRGAITSSVVREGGAFETWSLRKGVNQISCFVNGANATTAIASWMVWRRSFLALDASQPS